LEEAMSDARETMNWKPKRSRWHLFIAYRPSLIVLLLSLPSLVSAHPSGTSKLDVYLKPADSTARAAGVPDTLEALVDANRDDLVYSLQPGQMPKLTKEVLKSLDGRLGLYVQTRLSMTFDHGSPALARVSRWRKHGQDLDRTLDSSELYDTTLIRRLAWTIPPGAKTVSINSKLFAELEVQPISHMRFWYRGKVIREKWMEMDQGVVIAIEPDSLAARLADVTAPPGAAPGAAPMAPREEQSTILRFLALGFTHIIPYGLDHILFVLGLFLFSTNLRPLFIQVTAFTIAHSLTLGLAMLGVFSLPARVVEPLIALSIAVVAIENIFFRKMRPSRWMIVFGFGLVHGLGFAGALRDLGLPEGQFLKTLISFNLGVEGGQLAVIAAASALTLWMWRKPWYFRFVVTPISAGIALVGLYWAVTRFLTLS
jgi:hydrogenase/urease accessory protein HupE